jgi:hypothetical protein
MSQPARFSRFLRAWRGAQPAFQLVVGEQALRLVTERTSGQPADLTFAKWGALACHAQMIGAPRRAIKVIY